MLLEQTHEKLIAMKLYGMAHALKTRLERVDHQNLTKEEFFSLIGQYECRRLVVDLSKVEYATSAALGKLITLHRRMHRSDGQLVLCGVTGTLADILTTSRLMDYFNVAENTEEAAARLRSAAPAEQA